MKILLRNERTYGALIHTLGLGILYRNGKHLTGYKKLMYEGELVMMEDPKEKFIPGGASDQNSKSFIYGKLNYLFILRGGVGRQRVIRSKPYWGGVEIRNFYSGGVDFGFTKPVYLYIIESSSSPTDQTLVAERFDPNHVNLNNIYGRAPFTTGFNKMSFYPGLYGKFAFSFEFGHDDTKIRCLEVGVILDKFIKSVPIMYSVDNHGIFGTAYLSYSFGRRFNK